MSFSRGQRDQHYFTGSDDATAPDYVKVPIPRVKEVAVQSSRKQPLPKVPLKKETNHHRKSMAVREASSPDDCCLVGGEKALNSDHPLDKFERPGSLKPRNQEGELAKVTSIPYKQEESMAERRIASKGNKAAQELNRGIGIFA